MRHLQDLLLNNPTPPVIRPLWFKEEFVPIEVTEKCGRCQQTVLARGRDASSSLLHAHLVFCTKYRRSVITKRAFDRLRLSIRQTAQKIGIDIIAVQSDGDHLHLMILYPPSLDLSTIVKRLKGASSRLIRKLRLPEVLKQLWGRHFWSPSYFVVSCRGTPLDVIRTYVESQNDPDAKKRKTTPWPSKSKR